MNNQVGGLKTKGQPDTSELHLTPGRSGISAGGVLFFSARCRSTRRGNWTAFNPWDASTWEATDGRGFSFFSFFLRFFGQSQANLGDFLPKMGLHHLPCLIPCPQRNEASAFNPLAGKPMRRVVLMPDCWFSVFGLSQTKLRIFFGWGLSLPFRASVTHTFPAQKSPGRARGMAEADSRL